MPTGHSNSTERSHTAPIRTRWQWRFALVIGAGISAVVATGCGSATTASTTSTTSAATSTTSAVTSTTSATTSTTAPPYYEVHTGTVKGLGTVLVDGQGMTLYLFVPDKQSGTSTCYGACATAWPPLVLPPGVKTPLAGPGVKSSLLGTTHRTNGTVEITYNKWPLYLYVSDSQPGEATGQGINSTGGLWYVLSPNGNEITTKP